MNNMTEIPDKWRKERNEKNSQEIFTEKNEG